MRAVALALAVVLAGPAAAAVALRQQQDLRGDFRLFGNTLAQDRAAGLPAPVVGTLCTTGAGGSCGGSTSDSGADVFWRSEPALGTAACSAAVTPALARSTAVLRLPAGAVIRYARLYWAGYLDAEGYDAAVTLGTPDGAEHEVAADFGWTVSTAAAEGDNGRWWYQATADVTALLQGLPAAPGAYSVSGVDALPFAREVNEVAFAGWWAVVFYEDPAETTLRNLTLFDGFEWVYQSTTTATLSGFRVSTGGFDAKLGVVAFEGDGTISGDRLQFRGYTAPAAPPATLVDLSDAQNPANNFFNRTHSELGMAVSTPGDLPQLTGAPGSMGGIDLDVVDLKANGAIAAGNDAAVIASSSTGNGNRDAYVLAGFITSISTLKPDFTGTVKTVTNLDRAAGVLPHDVLEYAIETRNGGNDPAVAILLLDPLPPGLSLVPGSIRVASGPNAGPKTEAAGDDQADWDPVARTLTVRLGAGATATQGGSLAVGESTTVTFRVTVDPGAAGQIANQATVTAAGLSGQPPDTFPSHPPGGGGPTTVVVDGCVADLQCGGGTPACDTAASPRTCVGCTSDAHCGGAAPICDLAARACVARASLAPLAQERPAAPGTPVPFGLALRSALPRTERFELDVAAGPCAAGLALLDGAGALLASRDAAGAWTIAAGADADLDGRPEVIAVPGLDLPFTVRLTQDPAAAVGEACAGQVVATGQVTGPTAPAAVTVRAVRPAAWTPDWTGAAARVVPSGGTAAFPGLLQNGLASAATFDLAAAAAAAPGAGPLAPVTFFTDPDGDGDPADGVPVTAVGPLAPFGGSAHLVAVVRAATAAGAPLPPGTLVSVTATATAPGGLAAAQRLEAWVGWLVPAGGQAAAPCDTVQVRAERLPPADGWALEWYAGASPQRGVDLPLRAVDPWPVASGAAADALALPADAPGALTVLLVRRLGGAEVVLDALPLTVERGGTFSAFSAPARVVLGQPLPLSAEVRSDAAHVTHRATRLRWTVEGGGLALDGAGAFVPPPATARLLAGLDVPPGGRAADAFAPAPAWPSPGRYQVAAAWQVACGPAPALATAAAEVEVAPPPPALDALPARVATATPSLGGTALPGAEVLVAVDGAALAPVAAGPDGRFAVEVPAAAPLPDGAHLATATQRLGGVTSDPSAPRPFAVDTAPPALALASPADGALLNAAAAPGGLVTVAGTAEAGAGVTAAAEGVAGAVVRDGPAFTATLRLADGHHRVDVAAEDAAGNRSAAAVSFDLDATPPAAPVLTAPEAGARLGAARAAGGLVGFAGTAEPGASVRLEVGGRTATAVAEGGAFATALALADGAWLATATAVDAAGNGSPPATVAFTLDATPPAPPLVEAPAPGQLLDAAAAPGGLVTLRGAVEPGAEVRALVDGAPVPVAAAAGAFSGEVRLADGAHLASLEAVDAAGNRSVPVLLAFAVDAGIPAAPLVDPLPRVTAADPVPVTGRAEPGTSVLVREGGALVASAAVDAAGAFRAEAALAEGEHLLVASDVDAAGNASPGAPVGPVRVDRTPPGVPALTAPAPGALLGAAEAAGGLVALRGTAEPGAQVELQVDGGAAALVAGGDGAFALDLPLADGPHAVALRARDEAGNRSAESLPVDFTLDTAAPAAPVLLAAEGPTRALALAVGGQAEPGALVHFAVDGAPAGTALAGGDGHFAAQVALPAADGPCTITARAQDAARNTGPTSAPLAVLVDRTAPAAPVVRAPADGAELPAGPTRFEGTAEPGARLSLSIGGAAIPVAVDAAGGWSLLVDLLPGHHAAQAVAIDAAGNASPPAAVGFTSLAPAGPVDPGEPGGGGCGCGQGGAGAPSAALLLGLLACWPRRRTVRRGAGR